MIFWQSLGPTLVLVIPVFLLLFTVSTPLFARFFPGHLTGFTLLTFTFLWFCASTAMGLVIFNGPIDFSLISLGLNRGHISVVGFRADRLSLAVALLVITVSGIVHLFSIRAMQEERHFQRYFTLLSLITLEVLLVVLANNLLMLSAFWILKGLTLTFLLAHYTERPAAWRAAFKKLRIDLIGDTAFLGALVLVWQVFETFDFKTISARASEGASSLPAGQITLLTLLLLVAIMAKSAQFPLHEWLPGSVEAPTPVSALMHAGLINAGGYLFIRLGAIFIVAPLTMGLALLIGGVTAFYGTLVMLTRNDVKGKLVYSTMGQMGFMIIECALGAYALAILHLIAHGLFKANLFLGSGSVIEQKAVKQQLSPLKYPSSGRRGTVRYLFTGGLSALLFLTVPALLGCTVNAGTVLLAFAWITVIFGLSEVGNLPLKLMLPGTATLVLFYLGLTHSVETFFSGAIAPAPTIEVSLVWVTGLGLGLAGLVAVLLKTWGSPTWLRNFFNQLYVRVLFAGYGNGK